MSMIGKTLGHYSISSLIGAGGMGEVYQAKDQKLGRDVAIKVLPEEFAKDADRVARFQREAKLLASLNHPNIAAIHGLEEADGTHFLVLELIDGDTLADRLKHGAIPVEESLKLALQISEALEAAHEKGVIHRDLKPANIKVTPDGKVKVLDFGLAKAFAEEQAEVNLSNSPTLTLSDPVTQQGVILGTAAYMSPEQARGKPVDKRADIWAFGVVLFEMLTGRSIFSENTVSDTLASVLKTEPEWKSLPPNLHPRIRFLLERCLKKEPRDRYSGISDARVDIQEVLADPSGVPAGPISGAETQSKLRMIAPWAAITSIIIVIAGSVIWKLNLTPRPEQRHVTRLSYELPKDQQFTDSIERWIAVSPDGRQFVYATTSGLYMRSMDELDARLISGSGENPQKPFFSPDGKWVGYVARNQLMKIAVSGGTPVAITEIAANGLIEWETNDTIVFGSAGGGIMGISSNGGSPEPIVKAELHNNATIAPQILPDGESVLFTSLDSLPWKVRVQSRKSGERKELFEGDTARYIPTGHIVYANGNDLFAVPFNPEKREVRGGPVPVVEGVFRSAAPQYAVSDSGTLVYVPGTSAALQSTLVWVDRKGKEVQLSAGSRNYRFARISPDGSKIALAIGTEDTSDIWIWDIVRETMTRITFDGLNYYPLWTPDGKRIVFAKRGEAVATLTDIYWKAADGTGEEERLKSLLGRELLPWSWSGDGNTLALFEVDNASGFVYDIGTLSMKDNHEWKPLLNQKYNELNPKISPDGKWIAYASDELGRYEIFVRAFPDVSKGRWQVSTNGGRTPLWSQDGQELFYRNDDAVMRVSVETSATFKAGNPETLFRGTYAGLPTADKTYDAQPWDIHPDGKRFLMLKPSTSTGTTSTAETPRRINIVLNWFEELKKKVPVD